MEPPPYIRRAEAAAYLRERYGFGTYRSLGKLASVGGGPKFYKFGQLVFYRREDLDRWVASRLVEANRAAPVRQRSPRSRWA